MRIDLEGTRKVVHKALDVGITLFDTADIYGSRGGSEEMLGQILGENRKRIVLATKFGGGMDEAGKIKGISRRFIMSAAEASLKRLRTDWIDLYQIHFPRSRYTHRGDPQGSRRSDPRRQSALYRLFEFCRLADGGRTVDGQAL